MRPQKVNLQQDETFNLSGLGRCSPFAQLKIILIKLMIPFKNLCIYIVQFDLKHILAILSCFERQHNMDISHNIEPISFPSLLDRYILYIFIDAVKPERHV